MEFPLQLSMFIPIFFIAMLVYYAWKGYHNGLILEAMITASLLICMLVAWLLSDILGSQFYLVDKPVIDTGIAIANQTIVTLANRVIWFVLLFLITNVVLRILRVWIRKMNKIKMVGTLNQILGSVLALVKGCLYGIVLIVVLASPIFSNGKAVMNNSGITPIKDMIQQHVPIAGTALDAFDYIDRIREGEQIDLDSLLDL